MNRVQCAVVLLSVVELALMNGTFDGFVDFAHCFYLLMYDLYES